jgi:nucleoside-diphosphate-sugar epimerase
MKFTVLGANGFIGRNLVAYLHNEGYEVWAPSRTNSNILIEPLGHVFYCIGLTADFRRRPLDTVEAHVCVLKRLLRKASFVRLIYLSSTRIYSGMNGSVNEGVSLMVNPNEFSDLYNLSKLMGESACLHCGRDAVVARLSNVVGSDFSSDNFIFELIREACEDGVIQLRAAPESVKDYVFVTDVVRSLVALAKHPNPKPVYNVASGRNLSNAQVCEAIARAGGCRWEVSANAPLLQFPQIDISLAQEELGLIPSDVLNVLKDLVIEYHSKRV